jgi:hypothetical protein
MRSGPESKAIKHAEKARTLPIAPVAATILSALMMCIPHPYGAARVLQVVAFSVTGDSFPLAVALEALVVAVLTYAAYAVYAWRRGSHAGNIAAAVVFSIYALVFFAWVVGPLIG